MITTPVPALSAGTNPTSIRAASLLATGVRVGSLGSCPSSTAGGEPARGLFADSGVSQMAMPPMTPAAMR